MAVSYVSSYQYANDFNNSYTLTGVTASAGNMIIVACQGRDNAGKFNFATPTWNGETFTPVSEEFTGLTGLEVFRLITTTSGTFNITANAGSYGGITAVAIVASGTFNSGSVSDLVTSYWDTGTYSSPSLSVSNVASGNLTVSVLAAPKQNNAGIDVTTTYTSNGTIRATASTTSAPRVGNLYIATHAGTGAVTCAYTRSNSDEPVWRMAAFRIKEAGATIETTPANIRVTESRTVRVTTIGAVLNTGNTSVRINSISNTALTPSAVTLVSGNTYDVAFTVTDAYAGLKYSTTGYPIIVSTPDGDAASSNVQYLPVTGNSYVDITSGPGDFTVSLGTLVSGDQIEWETLSGAVSVDADCKITYTGSNPNGLSFDVRAWDDTDDTWGAFASQTLSTGTAMSGIVIYGLSTYGLLEV